MGYRGERRNESGNEGCRIEVGRGYLDSRRPTWFGGDCGCGAGVIEKNLID